MVPTRYSKPSKYLPVPKQQKKQKKVWNVSKVHYKNSKWTPLMLFWFLFDNFKDDPQL